MVKSRFNQRLIISLLVILSISFVLSLFVMQFAAGLLFILWLFEKNEEKKKAFDNILVFILVFGLVRLLSIFLSEYPEDSFESLYKEALFYTSAVAIPFYLKTLDKKIILNLMLTFIIGAAVVSLIGSARFLLNFVDRAQAFTSGYSVFSGYLLTAFSAALFFPQKPKSNFQIIFWSVIYLIILTGLATSLSRANLVIAICILISAIVLRKFTLKQIIILGLFMITGLLVYVYKPSSAIDERVQNITYLSDRDIIWQGAKEISMKHPVLGFGPRTFHHSFPFKDKFADKGIGSWHNDFLQIYFESGIIGLLTYFVLFWLILKSSFNQLRNKKTDVELKSLSASVLASMIALLLSSLFAGFITSVVLSIVFIFCVSFLSRIGFEMSIDQKVSY